jgi:hypothetical protein
MESSVIFHVNNYVIVASIVVVSLAHLIILSYLYLTVFDVLLQYLLEFWWYFSLFLHYMCLCM